MNGARLQSTMRRLLTVPIVVAACVLGLFVLFLNEALRPGFRGGWFIVATLLIGTALIAVVLGREVILALWSSGAGAEAGDTPVTTDEDNQQAVPWPLVGLAVATMVGFFAAILILGTVVGMTFAAWAILRWQSKLSVLPALIGAIAIGVVLPVAFASLLDLILWPGLVPKIVPEWIGGGILPPL